MNMLNTVRLTDALSKHTVRDGNVTEWIPHTVAQLRCFEMILRQICDDVSNGNARLYYLLSVNDSDRGVCVRGCLCWSALGANEF